MITNDNDLAMSGSLPVSDAHGGAALLLVESLIHGLCEHSVLTAGQAADIAERAMNVQLDTAQTADGAAGPMWQSHALLTSIATSLRIDDRDG